MSDRACTWVLVVRDIDTGSWYTYGKADTAGVGERLLSFAKKKVNNLDDINGLAYVELYGEDVQLKLGEVVMKT